ncbi:MAG: TM0106 family RecB-like putative nuclease, partial [Rubrimonas sp.]
MRHHDDRILLSASDLMRFIDCRHATALDLRRLRGEDLTPAADSEDAALLQAHGDAHEAAHLAALKASGRRVVEIARESLDLAAGVAATRAALAEGPEVVFQGALAGGAWGGWSDFLERVVKPSALGGFSYEVTDTKLKRKADPKHVLQLALYSDLLAGLQGAAPEHAHVALGGGGRATIRLQDYAACARRARARLEAFVADPPRTEPVPVAACGLCRWRDHCADHWAATDSLFKVANITRAQVSKLTAAGIATMRALGERRARVPRLADATLEKLATQARLQTGRSDGGGPAFARRAHQPGKGFDLLPRPDPGDLFYDIEGDPFVEGGLEYLHGVWAEDAGFRAFWAHDHDEERARLGELMDFLDARLTAHPRASIYHYAPYEITALRRLTTRYGVGEARLDRWLRERRFVDLYAVVRGALIASEPSYSIKDIEAFYDMPREGAVKTAGGSVVAYERWRATGEAAILDEIEDYNRIDCVSTQRLRDWLVTDVRPAGHPWPAPVAPAADRQAEADAEADALIARLAAAPLAEDRRRLLFDLAFFHRREAKPGWWAVFDGMAREAEELIEDVDCLGGLQAVGPAEPEKQSHRRTYRFPEQQTKLRAGAGASIGLDGAPVGVTIEALDRRAGRVTVKASRNKVPAWPDSLDLLPAAPITTNV